MKDTAVGMGDLYDLSLHQIMNAFFDAYQRDGRTLEEMRAKAEAFALKVAPSLGGEETIAIGYGLILLLLSQFEDVLDHNRAA